MQQNNDNRGEWHFVPNLFPKDEKQFVPTPYYENKSFSPHTINTLLAFSYLHAAKSAQRPTTAATSL